MGDLSKKKSSLGPIKQISKSLFKNVKFDKFPLILLHKKIVFLFKTLCQTTCMIYHMNLYIVCYISSPQKMSESKIHIFPIYGQMDPKTAIVHCARRKSENHQVLPFQSGFRDLENDAAYFFKQNKQ